MKVYAPIVIFCYRRKIERLIKSLKKNKEAKKSELFIFSDGYKSDLDKEDVLKVRKYINKINGFKRVDVITSDTNKGLGKSIIDGVTNIINKFEKIIVLEDDLVVSSYFLDFMNKSLNLFKEEKNIWSISGYSSSIPYLKNYKHEVYLSLRSSSWGWATWLDRWSKTDWRIQDFISLKNNKKKIKKFEKGGNDLFKMLELQYLGKIDSWAIRWCYSQFKNNTYSLTPKISTTQNIGFKDKYSTHNFGSGRRWKTMLAKTKIKNFRVSLDNQLLDSFKRFHDINYYTKFGYFSRKWGGYKIIKKIINIF